MGPPARWSGATGEFPERAIEVEAENVVVLGGDVGGTGRGEAKKALSTGTISSRDLEREWKTFITERSTVMNWVFMYVAR